MTSDEHLSQIDRICDDYEAALKANQNPSIASFLDRAKPEICSQLVTELVLADLEFRESVYKSRVPDVADYLKTLGAWAEEVRAAFVIWNGERRVDSDHVGSAGDGASKWAHEQTKGLSAMDASAGGLEISSESPEFIGPYRIHKQLGQGGMGTVWLAEQTDPVKRMVAIKVVKAGLDSEHVLARFDAERQALAMMDHPNIAKVLDAGTSNNAPYFVMELVDGIPITEFCDKEHLNALERIEVFIDVCAAVQHAHHKGVIHRDIKPSNIIVSKVESQIVVKVIDFGLAKAFERPLTEQSIHTLVGQLLGTPAYMSPEQAEYQGQDIDTRSDVYSLGVLIYELLTGVTPIGVETLKERGLAAFQELVRTFDTPAMSRRVDSLGNECDQHARRRSTDRNQLKRLLRGDLDIIVLKSLSKERERRYETPDAFASDLRRFLNCEPIAARPPTPAYRIRKSYERNKTRFWAATMLLLTLAGGFLGTTIGLVRARIAEGDALLAKDDADRRRDQAMEALDVMSSAVVDDWLKQQATLTADQEEFLNKILELHEKFLQTEPEDDAALSLAARTYERLGEIRRSLGRSQEAEADYLEAQRLYLKMSSEVRQTQAIWGALLSLQLDLASLMRKMGRWEETQSYLDVAREMKELEHGAHESIEARRLEAGLSYLDAEIAVAKQDYSAALESYGEAVKVMRDVVQEDAANKFDRFALARDLQAYAFEQRFESGRGVKQRKLQALSTYSESIEILEELVNESPGTASFRKLLAVALNDKGIVYKADHEYELAEPYYVRALDIRRSLVLAYPGDQTSGNLYGGSLLNLGNLYRIMGSIERSIELYKAGIDNNKMLVEADANFLRGRGFLRNMHEGIAESYLCQGRFAKALEHLDEAIFHNGPQFRHNDPQFDARLPARRLFVLARLGQFQKAVDEIEKLVEQGVQDSRMGDLFYEAALVYVAAAESAAVDAKQKQQWLDRSVQLLGSSRSEGFGHHGPKNVFWNEDPEFEVLYNREEYQALIDADRENIESRKDKQ
ncbi:MAG: serine/threonine-protein kinase [Planctomycetota bacterium]